VVQLMHTSSP